MVGKKPWNMDGKPTFSGDPFLEPCLKFIKIPTYKVESENHTSMILERWSELSWKKRV